MSAYRERGWHCLVRNCWMNWLLPLRYDHSNLPLDLRALLGMEMNAETSTQDVLINLNYYTLYKDVNDFLVYIKNRKFIVNFFCIISKEKNKRVYLLP